MKDSARLSDFDKLGTVRGELGSTLNEWYDAIRDIPLWRLGDGDLAKAIRQKLALSVTLIAGLKRLAKDPFAGEAYDGEMLYAISLLSKSEWKGAPGCEQQIKQMGPSLLQVHKDQAAEDEVATMTSILRLFG